MFTLFFSIKSRIFDWEINFLFWVFQIFVYTLEQFESFQTVYTLIRFAHWFVRFTHSFLRSRLAFSVFGCYSFFVYTLLLSVLSYRIYYNLIPVQDICVWDSSLVHCSIYMVGFQYFRYFRYICFLVSPLMLPFFVSVRLLLSAVPFS